MNFNEYQRAAISTAIYPKEYAIVYPTLGLIGEAGEVAEKVKKLIRDDNGVVSDEKRQEIKKELGDVLWYIANVANDLGIPMNDVAEANIEKLASRKERNQLHGNGDNR